MKDMFNGKEVPDVLPEIKKIDISDEEYENIQNMFKYQPKRSKREDQRCTFCLKSESILTPETCCTGCGALNTMET